MQLRASFWIALSLGGVACALTLLFLGMRSVMDIGGYCAEGGPYEIRQHCPQGIPAVMVGSIWGGLILAGVYAWQLVRHSVPGFLGLLWPALFLSLGWNFFEYGINPPGPQSGIVGGWLVCGVLFALMGALPLLAIGPSVLRGFTRGAQPKPGWPAGAPVAHARRIAARVAKSPAPANLVDELERLDALHRSGGLDESEYRLAKERLIARAD